MVIRKHIPIELREDCFGSPRWVYYGSRMEIECRILVYTRKRGQRPLNCATCSFYKTKEENDAELMLYNGTTNMNEILTAYIAGRTEDEDDYSEIYYPRPTERKRPS